MPGPNENEVGGPELSRLWSGTHQPESGGHHVHHQENPEKAVLGTKIGLRQIGQCWASK